MMKDLPQKLCLSSEENSRKEILRSLKFPEFARKRLFIVDIKRTHCLRHETFEIYELILKIILYEILNLYTFHRKKILSIV